MIMNVIVGCILFAFVVGVFEFSRGVRVDNDRRKLLEELQAGEHYRRLVRIKSSMGQSREYYAFVRRWNVPESDHDVAELWCDEGSNPDGWTQFFFWDRSDLEFVDVDLEIK